jgi:hypothetical protein
MHTQIFSNRAWSLLDISDARLNQEVVWAFRA